MKKILFFGLIGLSCVVCYAQTGNGTNGIVAPAAVPSYNQLVGAARKAMDEGRLPDGLLASMAAMTADDTRFEAYAVAALVKMKQGQPDDAKRFLAEARKRAPQEKQSKLDELGKLIDKESVSVGNSVATPVVVAKTDPLSEGAQQQLAVLKSIAADADRAQNSEERNKYLNEFLEKSDVFLRDNSNSVSVWTLRGLAAFELVKPEIAWESGRKLQDLKAQNDPKAADLIAKLDRKGWLGERDPEIDLTTRLISQACGKWRLINDPNTVRQVDKSWNGELIVSEANERNIKISGNFDLYSDVTTSSGSQMVWRDSGSVENLVKPQITWRTDGSCLLKINLKGNFRSNFDFLFGQASDSVTDVLELDFGTGQLQWPDPENQHKSSLDSSERCVLFVHGKDDGHWRKFFYLRKL